MSVSLITNKPMNHIVLDLSYRTGKMVRKC